MPGRFFILLLLLLLLPLYIVIAGKIWEQRAEARQSAEADYILPPGFSRVLALEHKGLLSDYQLLKTITFYGEHLVLERTLNPEDWQYIVAGLESVTDLDPYFLDPYILAESLLAWDAGLIDEANRLIEKGMEHRTWDWQLPFFVGFNHFYFREDAEKGAEYLMAASRLPGSPDFLPRLAARLGYYGGKAKTAIMFLRGILAQTEDELMRRRLEKRLLALERADLIEEAAERFNIATGRMPKEVKELQRGGYLKEIPEDPYGGEWVVLKTGRIFSTSRFTDVSSTEGDGAVGLPH